VNILRRMPLSRLLIACALAIALAAVATAVASSLGSGPTPPPQPLANAVHDALAAPPVAGVSARIQLTDHLVEGASLASQSGNGGPDAASSPLLTGASGRLWISAAGKIRVELQSESGDTQVIYDGQTLSLYDASSNTLYRMQLPQGSGESTSPPTGAAEHKIPSVEAIQNTITRLMGHVTLSGANPTNIAGQPAYSVRISPSHDGGLVAGAELAWDAARGVPLKLALYATSSSSPVLELAATDISYEAIPDSVFAFSPPPGATIHDISAPGKGGSDRRDPSDPATGETDGTGKPGSKPKPAVGAKAVQATLPFPLDSPASLTGLALTQVRSINFDGHPAALLTYGQGLAGVAVLESQAKSATGQSSGNSPMGSQLPTKVTINGASATELPTALGTLLSFQRAGVDYTVVGSVTPATAEAAARGL
jgi:outer membrane lipoprotein-sorting protein